MSYVAAPLRLDHDRETLGRLWAENMSDARIAGVVPERVRWLYERAPDGPTTTVLCRHETSGETVGCGSYYQRAIWVDGRRVRAGVLCDFAVTRSHRVAGAALTIQRALADAARAAGVELLYGYPNEKSIAIFKRVGYRVVGESTSWVKALRAGYKLRERLRWRPAAAVAAAPADLAFRLLDVARGLRRPVRALPAPLSLDDARTDGLWERARPCAGVCGVRSAAFLDWRYRQCTTAAHSTLGLFAPGDGRLLGYAVYKVEEGKALVTDLFAEDLDRAAEAVLLALSRALRREGADSLSLQYVGSPAFAGPLRRAGFVLRPRRRALVVLPGLLPEALRPRVLDPESWFVLDGDLDI